MLPYIPAARGLIPGPTHYATSYALLLIDEILQETVAMTSLHGKHSVAYVETEELQFCVEMLILCLQVKKIKQFRSAGCCCRLLSSANVRAV